MTPGEKVAQEAEKYVGVEERPMGSNRGYPYPDKWQKPWNMGYGWPWCGAYAKAMYVGAKVDDENIGHPSTAVMYQRAKDRGAIVSKPIPGAYILWPGVHVGIVIRDLGGGVCLTVEGNSSDGVRYRRRAYGPGIVFVAPKEVRLGHNPTVPARDYYLEDVAARPRMVGPWRTREAREKRIKNVKGFVRRVRVGNRFAAEIGGPKVYGPWQTAAQRDNAKKVLEDRLGRRLRPYSRPSKSAPAGKADALGKTT
jgi:hypothetical protein